jgi:hypothetical protein
MLSDSSILSIVLYEVRARDHHRSNQGRPHDPPGRRVDRGLIVTTEATITEHPKKEVPGMPGGGMGGMDY